MDEKRLVTRFGGLNKEESQKILDEFNKIKDQHSERTKGEADEHRAAKANNQSGTVGVTKTVTTPRTFTTRFPYERNPDPRPCDFAGEGASLAPDYVHPIIAYRQWMPCLFHDRKLPGWGPLVSFNGSYWAGRVVKEAKCLCTPIDDQLARTITHHGCGIYAYRDLEKLLYVLDYSGASGSPFYYDRPISGEVWLWGSVYEHEYGYRAEYAYPKCFYCPRTGSSLELIELANFYDIEVVPIPVPPYGYSYRTF